MNRLAVALPLVLLFAPALVSANEALDVLHATFRVTNGKSSGTGFLVNPDPKKPQNRQLILVTAAHVWQEMHTDTCLVVLRQKTDDDGFVRKDLTVVLKRDGKPTWKRHPSHDVAVVPVEIPDGTVCQPFGIDQLVDDQLLKSGRVQVGQGCVVACFPAQLEANQAGWPVLRRGSIATYPLFPVKKVRTFLLDYSTFGGDSGAPVATRPIAIGDKTKAERTHIVGLVIGMQRQTDKIVIPFEERVVHHPLGLAICVPAQFIRETIESANLKW